MKMNVSECIGCVTSLIANQKLIVILSGSNKMDPNSDFRDDGYCYVCPAYYSVHFSNELAGVASAHLDT